MESFGCLHQPDLQAFPDVDALLLPELEMLPVLLDDFCFCRLRLLQAVWRWRSRAFWRWRTRAFWRWRTRPTENRMQSIGASPSNLPDLLPCQAVHLHGKNEALLSRVHLHIGTPHLVKQVPELGAGQKPSND